MTLKLLIVEDEPDVAEIVAFGVRINWPDCTVTTAISGTEAIALFGEEQPDLVIVDLNIPAPDGFEVLKSIRMASQVPVLILTARNSTVDKIRALDLGADDYLTKPFDHLELLARLRALARRAAYPAEAHLAATVQHNGYLNGGGSGSNSGSGAHRAGASGSAGPAGSTPDMVFDDITIDSKRRQVCMRGQVVPLTSTEYRLLEELARHAGTVLPHGYLIEHVWGPEYAGEDHYLKVFIRRLRRKLGDDAEHPRYIQTEWGVGYRFVPSR
ncbi:MAG TPA: response regulator transcription factor [Chloroflexia bacterium]|nr:response regulator transcription factor [Chloroflexia bacterium]